ncbi:MAG: hypothetical protein BTN85_2199 [Candidatus Methanohalarchaeum thermophilum]|uniref:Uncharacterized protein n=1 Tax=Methanohalarchaeum thermophilum TaxID=1903181 RepID=A0A1Q6DRS7_METT1|nr:MAG: hypothetical protein BTN85_2199 [Candidatus Methanohalarchaeum thermophilum]
MEKLIKEKKFDSKSDFLRAAVQDFIRKEEGDIETVYEEDTSRNGD